MGGGVKDFYMIEDKYGDTYILSHYVGELISIKPLEFSTIHSIKTNSKKELLDFVESRSKNFQETYGYKVVRFNIKPVRYGEVFE